jgi:hypothetical protein
MEVERFKHQQLGGGVYPALDLFEGLCEVADGEVVSETPAPFVPLSITLTSNVPVGVSFIRRCSVDSSPAEMSSRYRSSAVPEGPGVSPAAMKTWRSGLPILESELATSVGVYSSAQASGVLSWKGSESR